MCLPQNLSSLVVYYNRDLFDAAGVPYPEAGWTWAEFLDAAKALTRDIDGDGLPTSMVWGWRTASSASPRSSGKPAASWSMTSIVRPG